MCVEAAVCFALDLPHGDEPRCVSAAVRALKIKLNDSDWSSNLARGKGLKRLALVQLGSTEINEKLFVEMVVELTIKKYLPIALRSAAKLQKEQKHKDELQQVAEACEREGTIESAKKAKAAASAAGKSDANAADAAATAAYAATYAATAAYAAAYGANAAPRLRRRRRRLRRLRRRLRRQRRPRLRRRRRRLRGRRRRRRLRLRRRRSRQGRRS